MKEKVGYIIAALIVYFVLGVATSYFFDSQFSWTYVVYWTIAMTIFDFFILRKINAYFTRKKEQKLKDKN